MESGILVRAVFLLLLWVPARLLAQPSAEFAGIGLGDPSAAIFKKYADQIYKERYGGFGAKPGNKRDEAAYKACGKGRVFISLDNGEVEYAFSDHKVYQWVFKNSYHQKLPKSRVAGLFIKDYGKPKKTVYYDNRFRMTRSRIMADRIVMIWDDLTSVVIIGEYVDERTQSKPFTYEIRRTNEASMREWTRKSRGCFLKKVEDDSTNR